MYENNIASADVVRRIIIGSHPIETTAKRNIMSQVAILDCSTETYTRGHELFIKYSTIKQSNNRRNRNHVTKYSLVFRKL